MSLVTQTSPITATRRPLRRRAARTLALALLATTLPLGTGAIHTHPPVRTAPVRPYTTVLGQHRLSPHHIAARPAGAGARASAKSNVSAAKAAMLALINAERARAGEAPLHDDATLNRIAQARSQDMIARHYFAHEIPGVPGVHLVFDILDRANVQYEMAGENIALNNYIVFYPMAKTIEQTNTDLMNSPEHKANILEPKYNEIGLGLAFEQATGQLILTEVFAQP